MKLDDLTLESEVSIDKYIEFRENVKKHMKDTSWIRSFSKNEILKLLDNNSKIWIYTLNDEIVCSMMFIKLKKEEIKELGFDLDESQCGEIGSMMVNYNYIGNGLQYQMLDTLDSYFKINNIQYELGTIHPDNIYSIKNATKSGFTFVSKKIFDRGLRNIYIKDVYNKAK